MRRALSTVVAIAVVAAAGCGGSGSGDTAKSGLAWDGTPKVFRAKNLPNDRVVIAKVKNAGTKTLHLVAARLKVRDADGHALVTSAAFATDYAHGLFGALQQPKQLPPAELIRLGKVAYIPAGATVPFYAAWRLTPGAKEPVTIDYGAGTLAVPEASGTASGL
ncbi:MAG: hypothetical protein JWM73_1032 [Solirubrobacterales bacterium]|nr:hypothetical protein [Solirubrobacterales bacterium]